MKRYYLILLVSLFVGFSQLSCSSSHKEKNANASISDSITDDDDPEADYSQVVFDSPEQVKEFINFKKFEDEHGYIAFNGKGGVMADEAFLTDSIVVKDNKSAEIFISIPKMKMAGRLLLKVEEKKVILQDEETHTDYRLKN